MALPIKIDFVSDISCPWCVVGLGGLEVALERIGDAIDAEITFQPFELNPAMPAIGQNIVEHVTEKYGSTPEQSAENRNIIRDRAASIGFTMSMTEESRIYNTFDAHRLLYWAEGTGHQGDLKKRLFQAYFTEGKNPADRKVLVEAAREAGLDPDEAGEVLATGRFEAEVRQVESLWLSRGISSVPAVVINDRYLISGGQPPEAFEDVLRTIATEAARKPGSV